MTRFGPTRFGLGAVLCWLAVSQHGVERSAHAAPVNDNFAERSVLSGATNFILAANTGATIEPGEPPLAETTGGSSVWWTWTAPASGTFIVSTAGSGFDTLLGVYFGSVLANLTPVVSDDDSGANGTSAAFFRAIAGETYQIVVDGFQGESGNLTLRLGPSGYPQPAWRFYSLTGSPLYSTDLRNKVVLLDFFETSCGACIDETPALLALRNRRAAEGFALIAVSKDALPPNEIRYHADALHIDYPIVLNSQEVEASFGGPLVMPSKILIDREGKIQRQLIGGNTLNYYDGLIAPLLRGAASLKVNLRTQPGRAVLAWPATEFGYVAEGTTNLTGGVWTRVSTPVVVTNDENTVTVPTTGQATFYRLRKP